ncbi:STM3941 family protein [Sphingopyxis chilensis]
MQPLVARNSRWRILLIMLGALAFVAAGVWIAGIAGPAPSPGKEWAGWLSIIFFGVFAPMAFSRLLDDDVQIRISRSGIYYKQWSEQTIPWEEIAEISVWKFKRHKLPVLHLVHPGRYPSTTLSGKMARADRMLTGGDITITLTGMDCSFDEVVAAIQYHRSAHQRPPVSPQPPLRGFGRRGV